MLKGSVVWTAVGVVALAVIGALLTRAEPFAPTVAFDAPARTIGRATPLTVVAHDRGSGLAHVEVRIVPAAGDTAFVVDQRDFPRTSWRGSGVDETTLTSVIDAAAIKLPEGPATIEATVTDHSWMGYLRRPISVRQPVTVDFTPPTVEVLTNQHILRLGGAETVVYRVGADAVWSGVVVGTHEFPGTQGYFADGSLRVAVFAAPPDVPGERPVVIARDAAGNSRTAQLDVTIRSRRFPERTLQLSQEFLAHKVPELLRENGLPETTDLVAGYRQVNGELRAATEARVREICRESSSTPLWQGGFLSLPNGAPLAAFADQRRYEVNGEIIDRATHLGYDLASQKASLVPAANTGRVVFAGPLGIYGNAVILDHGLGVFSLYGHLSSIEVRAGQSINRGEPVGRTGETGLAGGDHLHFGVLVHHTYVDPVEWWDGHWIHDHVESRLAAFPRAETVAGAK